ncbi:hypothetical protein FQR65_LT16509 [Abscondita terminalis]|nr:hypothetical protein FQR65_LT16509 [Abscondita terminalis]
MPIMSGFEAIREIKNHADPVKANTPIITISASVLESEQAEAYEVGADGVISKPFDAIDLYNRIIEFTMKKLFIIPALALAVAFTSCGGESKKTSTEGNTETTSTETQTPQETVPGIENVGDSNTLSLKEMIDEI